MRNAQKSLWVVVFGLLLGCSDMVSVEQTFLDQSRETVGVDTFFEYAADLLPFRSDVTINIQIDKGFPRENSYDFGLYNEEQWMDVKRLGDSRNYLFVKDADSALGIPYMITIPRPTNAGKKTNRIILGVRCKSKTPTGMSMPCGFVITLQASTEIPIARNQ